MAQIARYATSMRNFGIDQFAMPKLFIGICSGCEVPALSVVRVSIVCVPAVASHGNVNRTHVYRPRLGGWIVAFCHAPPSMRYSTVLTPCCGAHA